MSARRTRGGVTLVEVLVAGALLAGVLGVTWRLAAGTAAGRSRVYRYAGVLQAAASVHAYLGRDLAAAWVPAGAGPGTPALEVAPDGKSVVFERTVAAADPEATGPEGPGRERVRWAVDAAGVLTREVLGGDTRRWEGTPLQAARFLVEEADGQLQLRAELAWERAPAPGRVAAPLSLALLRRLGGSARLPEVLRQPYPDALLGPPPAPSGPAPEDAGPVDLETL